MSQLPAFKHTLKFEWKRNFSTIVYSHRNYSVTDFDYFINNKSVEIPFLKLPAEIRQKILGDTVSDSEILDNVNLCGFKTMHRNSAARIAPLLTTNGSPNGNFEAITKAPLTVSVAS
jgi:hypothetical protein